MCEEADSEPPGETALYLLPYHSRTWCCTTNSGIRLVFRGASCPVIGHCCFRYTFDDVGVPRWLREDEARHLRPPQVVTQQEIAAEKEALRAIDARPLKKVRRCLLRVSTAHSSCRFVRLQVLVLVCLYDSVDDLWGCNRVV